MQIHQPVKASHSLAEALYGPFTYSYCSFSVLLLGQSRYHIPASLMYSMQVLCLWSVHPATSLNSVHSSQYLLASMHDPWHHGFI